MLNYTKSTTFTGTVEVETVTEMGTQKETVAYLSASIPEDGTPNVSKSIQNKDLYLKHKTEVDKDMQEFEDIAWAQVI
mgnify:CR=1 FL=1|jgi:hypothetical protein